LTPETCAARDRLRGLLGANKDTGWPVIDEHVDADLRLVLADLDRYEAIEESVRETARQVAEHAEQFGPVPERVEITYEQPIPVSGLAWAREQVEQAAAKYDAFAENEPNPLIKTAMQFAAQIMRAELIGGTVNGNSVTGRFGGAGEPGGRHA
jgi:hypothetical protein